MSVVVTYRADLTSVETLTGNPGHMSDDTVTSSLLNKTLTGQTSTSSPPCAKRGGSEVASGSSIDLTAMIGANGATVDGTGLRVQFAKFVNPITNANPITVKQGASNGYDGFGASFLIILAPGAEVLVRANDAGSDVGSTKKTLDVVGTGVQPISYEIVVG